MNDVAHFIAIAHSDDVVETVLYHRQVVDVIALRIRNRAGIPHTGNPLARDAGLFPEELEADLMHAQECALVACTAIQEEIDKAFRRRFVIMQRGVLLRLGAAGRRTGHQIEYARRAPAAAATSGINVDARGVILSEHRRGRPREAEKRAGDTEINAGEAE